jgi:archaeosine-15-forming tRNA-guanine transglycosylase
MELGLPMTARQYAEEAAKVLADNKTHVDEERAARKAQVFATLAVAASIQEHGLFSEHPDD